MTYRVLVTGSRTFSSLTQVIERLDKVRRYHSDLVIVHGDCQRGADKFASLYALANRLGEEKYPAKWSTEGRGAGMIRNVRMVNTRPDFCIAFKNGDTAGTMHCIEAARKAGIEVDVVELNTERA